MFLTKKKEEQIIEKAVSAFKESQKKEKWKDFFYANKKGFLIRYQGLEWECEGQSKVYYHAIPMPFNGYFNREITLNLSGQKKKIMIREDEPENVDFVWEQNHD